MATKRIDIIGPYPPPLGGISQHIIRMEYLLQQESFDYKIYNHGSFHNDRVIATNKSILWYLGYLLKRKRHLIHFHHFFLFHFLYYYLFSKWNNSKIIISLHDEQILNYRPVLKKACIWLLKSTKVISLISVSEKLSILLKKNGVENKWLPAYVPPFNINPIHVEKIDNKDYFIFSIWKIESKICESIYNIDLAFELLSKIKNQFNMLFLIGSKTESDLHYLKSLLTKHNVEKNVTLIFEKQLVDYLQNGRFLLRTNNVDGYGVSLQESIELGVPAIASDVCKRPEGTLLFEKGNLDYLYEVVLKLINNKEDVQQEISSIKADYHLQLLQLYKANT